MSKGRAIQREDPKYKVETISRVFSNVTESRGPDWWDCENWDLPLSTPDGVEIADLIGSGKYADVFTGYIGTDIVALKIMKPVRPLKYNREAKILMNLKDGPNIVKLIKVVKNPESQQLTFIFEYIQNTELNELIDTFTEKEAKYYLFQLLRAIHYAHSNGIMHRDIKPQNIMYDRRTGKLRLIDWGLAEFYRPKRRYNIHVASRNYKAIELLVDYQCYDYSVDMWGFGVTMAGIIFKRTPFFKATDDFDMVARVAKVLGGKQLNAYLDKYGIQIPREMASQIGQSKGKDWSSFVTPQCSHLATSDAIDLVSKCVRYDHTERITAEEALNHPYFDDVRDSEAPL